MKNKRPNVNLQYNWIWYLAVVLIAILWWSLAFQMFHSPTSQDRVSIFFGGDIKDYSLADTLEQTYDIRLVEIRSCNPNATQFTTKYSVVGLNSSNIIIVSKSVAEKTYCAESFVALQDLGLHTKNAFVQADSTDDNSIEIAYGILLDNQFLSQFFALESDVEYYLFVGGTSLDEDGNLYTHTLDVINYFCKKDVDNA